MSAADSELLQAVVMGSLLAWASGLRLYLAVFAVGLAARLGYVTIAPALSFLTHDYVIGAAGILLAVEFLADKVPGIDSAWDAFHTFVRIPAGALLAAGAAGDDHTAITIAAGLLGGTITAGTHFAKAGGRLAINTSPEPFSNWVASFSEDAVVVVGIWLAMNHPVAFLVGLAMFLLLSAWLVYRLAKLARELLYRARRPLARATGSSTG